tara:strand:+ start:465 stop:833 length:369 start_codon:yes stop_codon:yes gene_type:complete
MLKELKSLSRQLTSFGLSVKADHVDLLIRSIAGDNQETIDNEIEFAIGELVLAANRDNIADEISDLLMLHSDYTTFLDKNLIKEAAGYFYVKNSRGSVITKLTECPEKAVALSLLDQSRPNR